MMVIHPGFVLILAGLVILICPKTWSKYLQVIGSAIALGSYFTLSAGSFLIYRLTKTLPLELIHFDNTANVFTLIFLIIALMGSIYALSSDNTRGERAAHLIYAGAGVANVLSGDIISFTAFWELMAIASIYIVYAGSDEDAKGSSYRYMVMHLFGGNLVLAGAVFLYMEGYTGVTTITGSTNALVLMFAGIGINAALPPFHTWLSDSYPRASLEGMLFMGSFTTKAAIYAMIRFISGTDIHWLPVFGGLMAIFGACMALLENDIRRLLSYHIVSQLGMMVAGLAAGGEFGIAGAELHAAYNILYKGVLMMCAGAICYSTGGIRKISDLAGMGKRMPFTCICFFIAALSISGFPFLNGFASKALIMHALEEEGLTAANLLVTVAGVGTWLSITMKIGYFVFIRKPSGQKCEQITLSRVPVPRAIAMMMTAIMCIITGVIPDTGYSLAGVSYHHVFSASHILEYLGLFTGGTAAFILMIKLMEPHEGETLDFDWIWRKAVGPVVEKISILVNAIFEWFRGGYNAVIRFLENTFGTPYLKGDGDTREEVSAGTTVSLNIQILLIASFVILAIILAALIK